MGLIIMTFSFKTSFLSKVNIHCLLIFKSTSVDGTEREKIDEVEN